MNYADDSYSVSNFSINSSDGSGGTTAVASLMVAAARGGFGAFDSREKKTRIYSFSLSFALKRRIIVEKSAYFSYNRTDRESEERKS